MQVDCGASANRAADSYHLILGGKCHSDSAQHALMEPDSVLFDCMCIELAEVQEVALGCDGQLLGTLGQPLKCILHTNMESS